MRRQTGAVSIIDIVEQRVQPSLFALGSLVAIPAGRKERARGAQFAGPEPVIVSQKQPIQFYQIGILFALATRVQKPMGRGPSTLSDFHVVAEPFAAVLRDLWILLGIVIAIEEGVRTKPGRVANLHEVGQRPKPRYRCLGISSRIPTVLEERKVGSSERFTFTTVVQDASVSPAAEWPITAPAVPKSSQEEESESKAASTSVP